MHYSKENYFVLHLASFFRQREGKKPNQNTQTNIQFFLPVTVSKKILDPEHQVASSQKAKVSELQKFCHLRAQHKPYSALTIIWHFL